MDIGKKLRELRKQNDLTLEDLASRSELTKGFLSQVERNLTAPRSCSEQMISSLMRKKITRWNGSFRMPRRTRWSRSL